MTIAVRTARLNDIPEMHRIRCAVRENRLSRPDRIAEADYAPFVAAGAAWVAEEGGAMLGFAAADRASASVWALFVAPEAEGRGAGRALHARILAWAREQGLGTLRLGTAPGTRAEQFYRAAGWRGDALTADGEVDLHLRIADPPPADLRPSPPAR